MKVCLRVANSTNSQIVIGEPGAETCWEGRLALRLGRGIARAQVISFTIGFLSKFCEYSRGVLPPFWHVAAEFGGTDASRFTVESQEPHDRADAHTKLLAASGMVAPSSTATTTRLSSEYGFAIMLASSPVGSLNHSVTDRASAVRWHSRRFAAVH